ncbi:hypothetical protein MTR_2g015660 [Medicago truncatula]|uniref:Uncharacterized protein n=1 Tax=Medicago truncatula TaxID=3880 RepID=G7IKB2_MEDTR|nr:hypothetical protein MTR_2g015660 [Medicago truncatula]
MTYCLKMIRMKIKKLTKFAKKNEVATIKILLIWGTKEGFWKSFIPLPSKSLDKAQGFDATEILKVCCGGGSLENYNDTALCGNTGDCM